MIRICLGDQSPQDRAWGRGLVEIDGEMYKLVLFSGSATEEWTAQLQPILFQEIEEESKIGRAVREELERPPEEVRVINDPLAETMRLLKRTNPELVDSVQVILDGLKGGEKDD